MAAKGANRLVPAFQPGMRRYDGKTALRLMQYVGPDEDELARFERAQLIWEGLYARFAGPKASDLARVVSGFGARLITDAPPLDTGAFFAAFAGAGAGLRSYRSLPVSAVGSGEEAAFRLDQTQFDGDLSKLLTPSRPAAAAGTPVRVQILNGNGQPEIGLSIAKLLVPAGFRIADTGNASNFGFRRTQIVAYSDADLPAARRIRALLGVGSIEIGRTQQSIVDVTIVVGSDFVPSGQ